MVAQNEKLNAELKLRKIREDCHRWWVGDDIRALKEYLSKNGLTAADIGSSEEELRACLVEGNRTSARSWLKVARENYQWQDVTGAVAKSRSRLREANLTLADIDSSEEELAFLIHPPKSRKFWSKLLRRNEKSLKSIQDAKKGEQVSGEYH